jgi:hypothetical protein
MANAQPIRAPKIGPESDAQAVRLRNFVAGNDKIEGDVATITLGLARTEDRFAMPISAARE